MKRLLCYFLALLTMVLISACESHINVKTNFQEELYVYASEFRIWRVQESDSVNLYWIYEIGRDENILFIGNNDWHEPKISKLKSNIIRLEIGTGTSSKDIKYFNINSGIISPKFEIMSVFADNIDLDYSHNNAGLSLIASPHYSPESRKTVIVIRSIFDDSFYLEIDEGFLTVLGGINNMIFLRENELYIDYDIFEIKPYEGERLNKRAVAVFDSIGYTFTELGFLVMDD